MRLISLFVLALSLCLPTVTASAGETVDRIVAVVNGDIVTLFEINERIKPVLEKMRGKDLTQEELQAILDLKKKIVERLVDDILLEQQAEKFQISASDLEVENEINDFKRRNSITEEEFVQQLMLEGLTREDFQDRIRRDILKQRLISVMVKRKVVVTGEEIQEYYDSHKENYYQGKQVGLSLLVLPVGQEADALKERIATGGITFDEALATYADTSPDAQAQGIVQGDIGVLDWEMMADEWRESLADVSEGGVGKPLVIQNRQALLKVVSLRVGDAQPLEAVQEAIRNTIRSRKLEDRFNEYMTQLRTEAVIEIKL